MDVIEPCGFPLSDRAMHRAAMDYAQQAELVRHPSWLDFLENPVRGKGRLVLFTTRGAEPFTHFRFQPDDVLLFGRESAGVPPEVHDAAGARLFIPLTTGARSLNVVTSAAMAISEALRQTDQFPKPAP